MIKSINLFSDIAEIALKDRFNGFFGREDAEILTYCREHYPPIFNRRVEYRLQRRHIDCIVVDSVLADLLPTFRQVIYLKYAKKLQMTKISLDCGLSVVRIVALDHDVREEIRDMLMYKLTSKNLYSRAKLVNMLHILDLRLCFLEQYPEFTSVVSRDWIRALEMCRERYRNLYTMIEEIIRNKDNDWHCNIIATKLQNPNCTLKELSAMCHVSQSGICRHLQTFETEASEYLF